MNIYLFTDYGRSGSYQTELSIALQQMLNNVHVFDLFADAPVFNPHASAHLLAAYAKRYANQQSAFLAVVDPGVGSNRRALALNVDGCWFVGPDNGLLEIVAARARHASWYELPEPEARIPLTFHGRDWFAPALADVLSKPGTLCEQIKTPKQLKHIDDLAEVIYLDHYGNAFTGIHEESIDKSTVLLVNGYEVTHAETFSSVTPGELLWHVNSIGLIEISANQANASELLSLQVGSTFTIVA